VYEIGRFIERNIDNVVKSINNCDTYFEELLDDTRVVRNDKNNILTVPNLYLYTYVYLKKIKR
jgi:hypothetical protein